MSCCKEKSSCINIYCCGNEGSDQTSQAEPIRTQFYVSVNNGSDTEGNGTQEKPWKTILYALSKMPDLNSPLTNAILYLDDGTYTVSSTNDLLVGYGARLTVIGNLSDPSKVVIEQITANNRLFIAYQDGDIMVRGVTLKCSGNHTSNIQIALAAEYGKMTFCNCIFEGNHQYQYGPCAYDQSFLTVIDCKFTGSKFFFLVDVRGDSHVLLTRCTIPNNLTVESTAFNLYHYGHVTFGGVNSGIELGLSGASITGKKYVLDNTSTLGYISNFTNTCTIAGTASNGGIVY